MSGPSGPDSAIRRLSVGASDGGDPTVAWRIVSLIRDRQHPHGNLGPVDPQITVLRHKDEELAMQHSFGSEDLAAFFDYARTKVGLSDQRELMRAFELFCNEVGAVPIGVATRSAQLSMWMGERLLKLHMREPFNPLASLRDDPNAPSRRKVIRGSLSS